MVNGEALGSLWSEALRQKDDQLSFGARERATIDPPQETAAPRRLAERIEDDDTFACHPSKLVDQAREFLVCKMMRHGNADGDVDGLVAKGEARRVTHDGIRPRPDSEESPNPAHVVV